jgi:hypothetical protein
LRPGLRVRLRFETNERHAMNHREKLATAYASKYPNTIRNLLEAAYLAGMDMIAQHAYDVVRQRNQLGLASTLRDLLKETADE